MLIREIGIRVCALVFASAVISPAYADSERTPACSNATLHGEFGFTARGTTFTALGLPSPLTGAFASSGTAQFDGNGHFTLTANSSFNGFVQGPATVTGTYKVNPDCSYTSEASNGATFRAVIVGNGREILILQTNSGTAITGIAERARSIPERRATTRRQPSSVPAQAWPGHMDLLQTGSQEHRLCQALLSLLWPAWE